MTKPIAHTGEKTSFLKRVYLLFTENRLFMALIGVVAPALCVTFDPVLFKGTFFRITEISQERVLFYGCIGIEMALMIAYIVGLPKKRFARLLFAGMFIPGALLAFAFGSMLLPYTLVGLLVVIGVLGLIPFFSAAVYLLATIRLLRTKDPEPTTRAKKSNRFIDSRPAGNLTLFLGILLIVLLAFAFYSVEQTMRDRFTVLMYNSMGNLGPSERTFYDVFKVFLPRDYFYILYVNSWEPWKKGSIENAFRILFNEDIRELDSD